MGKITGLENIQDVPPKVLLMYEAVEHLIREGVDINDIRVSTITNKAGIGKGTAYDYFDTKEEILACAVAFYMRKGVEELNRMLERFDSFTEQIEFLLEEIEKTNGNQKCLMRYSHMMTDISSFSRLVQEKMHTADGRKYLPTAVFANILKRGIERGEVRKDLPIEYMVYVLFSKMISYMICFGEDGIVDLQASNVRSFICKGILDELCEGKS